MTTLRCGGPSGVPAPSMGRSVDRPSACRLQSQRWSLNLELNLRQLSLRAPTACTDRWHPIAPRRWAGARSLAALRALHLLVHSGIDSLIVLMPGEIHRRSSEPGPGGQCASIRASPLEPRIAPSSAQRPERAQHASGLPRFALVRLQVPFTLACPRASMLTLFAALLRSPSACYLGPGRHPGCLWRSSELRCRWDAHACVQCTGCCACVLEV